MNLDVIFNESPDNKEAIECVVKKIAQAIKLDSYSATLVFVDKDEMLGLQKEFKNKDYITDVLSFPVPKEEQVFEHSKNYLGDIIICLDKAKEQANEYGHDLSLEIAVLFAHGLLHLCGLDHERNEDEANIQMQTEMYLLECVDINPQLSLLGRCS